MSGARMTDERFAEIEAYAADTSESGSGVAAELLAEVKRLRAPTGSPMDRERLAELRACIPIAVMAAEDNAEALGELLADRDHWAAESDAKSVALDEAREVITAMSDWQELANLAQGAAKRERDRCQAMAASIFNMSQGVVTGETNPQGDPVSCAEDARDRVIGFCNRVVEIYGDRAETMGGAYGDAFDMIDAALRDLAIAYERLGAAGYDDGVEEALDVVLARAKRCPVTDEEVEAAGVTVEIAAAWTDHLGLWVFTAGEREGVAVTGPGVNCGGYAGSLAFCITQMAKSDDRCAHDILGEMAAMVEVSP